MPLRGELWMDAGAVRAVRERSKSLFSAGIVRVSGEFAAQVCAGTEAIFWGSLLHVLNQCLSYRHGICAQDSRQPGRTGFLALQCQRAWLVAGASKT